MKKYLLSIIAISFLLSACDSKRVGLDPADSPAVAVAYNDGQLNNQLSDYWYQGKAELSRYRLEQNRYQDTHPGEVVMIFVTEDFLTDKQVKNDHYQNPNSVSVLKNNIVKTFPTGIYTYNIMTSVFTPVNSGEYPATLKVSNSSQEWCGQTYMQVNYNYRKEAYDYLLHSYFENEADQTGQVKATILEEELFNRIRINPETLPTGELELLPSTEYSRLAHRPYAPARARLELADYEGTDFEGEDLRVYVIEYPELRRTLEIAFEREAPFRIAGWKDTYPSAFDKQPRTTIARRTHTIMDAYWSHNSLADMSMRSQLGLE